jgi:hypothetical protein
MKYRIISPEQAPDAHTMAYYGQAVSMWFDSLVDKNLERLITFCVLLKHEFLPSRP